ncbi:MAG: S26 family signal peptidase [Methanoregula sp.]|nr:MAG: S26 family signal peptidase [Methanoregula sp.]
MAGEREQTGIRARIEQFRTSEHWVVSLARDILWLVAVVGGIALALYLICGTWPAVVTIESESMVPHMNVGDLVVVVQKDRYGEFQTWDEGKKTSTIRFGDYGDVLIYQPNGANNPVLPIPLISKGVHPIIHRAMTIAVAGTPVPSYINPYRGQLTPSEYLPLSTGNTTVEGFTLLYTGTWNESVNIVPGKKDLYIQTPDGRYVLPAAFITPGAGYVWVHGEPSVHSGYITKGDNNIASDQASAIAGLGALEPVKDEWVIGKALFAIPLVGLLPLHIVEVIIVVVAIMVIHELYLRRKGNGPEKSQKKSGKKKR